MAVDIGIGKTARRVFGLDEIAIVPTRRTRDSDDVDLRWQLDAYPFSVPMMGAAMDSTMSPATVIEVGRLGGLGVLNLQGLWTRYQDPLPIYREIVEAPRDRATALLQEVYREPVKESLIGDRIKQVRDSGVITAASLTPQNTLQHAHLAAEAGLDLLVIQGTVVSAEHVSTRTEPLNLKKFIAEYPVPVVVGGCSSYSMALHLMRTGAVGILVGVGPGAASATRKVLGVGVSQATAIADAAGARVHYLLETGRYVHVIADGGMRTGGEIAKVIACGADAVMLGSPLAAASEAPGRGFHWGMHSYHPTLPRGVRIQIPTRGSLREVMLGPATESDGFTNLFGALRRAMSTTGYSNVLEFQKAEVAVAPSFLHEGKQIQQAQRVGMD
ncbi:MAG: GuaB3 family IMP dehydrogenase-related protein [Actinomycetia bacterium]|nr:GuaB3 family IMP dehydrogenase-related protein [Actinomycetes bacterium]